MKEEKKLIETYKVGKIGVIHFNDPPLNIITKLHKEQLDEAIKWAEHDDDMCVLVFKNTGKCFGAGGDVNEMKESEYKVDKMEGIIDRISNLPMPTIAAMDGSAYGGSFEVALACDMRIAAKGIILAMTEVNFGSFPGIGGTPRLIELMGPAKAIETILLAYKWPAEEWIKYDVINAITDKGTAFEMAMEWAKIMEEKPFTGPRAVKDGIRSYLKARYEDFMPHQQRIMMELAGKGDIMESSKDFLKQ